MLAKAVVTFASLLAAVSAIQVTSPSKGDKLDFSETNEITWSSVSTDPTTFSIVLVDQSNMDTITIAASVDTADGEYSFSNFDATPGSEYRINLIANTPRNSGILAQSEEFEITNAGTEDATSTTSQSGTSSALSAATRSSSSTTAGTATATGASTTAGSSSTFSTGISTPTTTSNSTTSQPSGATTTPNAAATLGKTFGVSGSLLAALFMLL